jgi:hypothetical protein
MRNFLWSSRRRKTATASTLAFLLVAAAAVAAFIVYTGASGSGSAHVQNATTLGAITISSGDNPELSPGATTGQQFQFHNNDPGAAHTVTSLSGNVTSSPSECSGSISFNASGGVGVVLPPSGNDTAILTWTVSNSIPASCAGATVNVSLSGTTSP